MVRNLGQWPLKRGLIAKIRPSDACGRNTVLFALERWYNFLGLKVIWGMSAKCPQTLEQVKELVLGVAVLARQLGAEEGDRCRKAAGIVASMIEHFDGCAAQWLGQYLSARTLAPELTAETDQKFGAELANLI